MSDKKQTQDAASAVSDVETVVRWRRRLRSVAEQLETLLEEIEDAADKAESIVMKKTTQRSPEWRGGANCCLFSIAI